MTRLDVQRSHLADVAAELCRHLDHEVTYVPALVSGCVGDTPWLAVSLGEGNQVFWTEKPEAARAESRWYALLHEACHGALYNEAIPFQEHEDVYSDIPAGGVQMALEHALVRQYAPSLLRSLLREHSHWFMPLPNDPPSWQWKKGAPSSTRRKIWLARSYERVRQATVVSDLFSRVGASTEYRASN